MGVGVGGREGGAQERSRGITSSLGNSALQTLLKYKVATAVVKNVRLQVQVQEFRKYS